MHAPIGMLVIHFEHLVKSLREFAVLCFVKNGLKNRSLAEIALSGLTAGPLGATVESVVHASSTLSEHQQVCFSDVLKRFRRVTEQRNAIVHGVWNWIDWSDFPDKLPEGISFKSRRKSDGLHTDVYNHGTGAENLRSVITEIELLNKELLRLYKEID